VKGKNPKSVLFKVTLGLIITFLALILLLVAVVFWMADPLNFRAPKDQKLIAIFHAHREAFEKIQQMATEDAQHGLYLHAPFFDEGSKFDKSRQEEYEKLISEIRPGLHVSIDGREKGMSFTFAGGGLLAIGPGWEKGINYEPNSFEVNGVTYQNRYVGVILTNLDNACVLPDGTTYIRQIEPHWFLFYSRED
jgi:hypothetical protein